EIANLIWDLRRAGITTQISLGHLEFSLRGSENAHVTDLPGSGRVINQISIGASANITGTYLLIPAPRTGGYFTLPDGGINPGTIVNMPTNLEVTLFHELGHIRGALRTTSKDGGVGVPVRTPAGPNDPINVDAMSMAMEARRVFG